MRSTLAVLIFLTHTAASAQMQWTHEVLFDDVTYLEGQFADAMVSDDGIPLYRAARRSAPYLHTYYYRTNLNALYFSVPSVGGPGVIGRSGKVAFLARTATTYHVIGDGRDYFAEVEAPSLEGYVQLTDVDSAGRPVWSRTFTQWQDRFYYGSRPIGVGLPLDNKSGKVAPNGDLIWGGGGLQAFRGPLRTVSTSTTRSSPNPSSGPTTTRTVRSSTTMEWLRGAGAVTTSAELIAGIGNSS